MDEKRIRVIPATNSRRLLVDDDSPVITRKKRVAEKNSRRVSSRSWSITQGSF